MAFFLFVTLIATLLASTEGLNQIQLPPTVIPGQYETCPPEEILDMSRQNLSAKIKDILYHYHTADYKGVLDNGHNVNGVYKIQPDDLEPFDVYCDMETDGGGWTVFQRRQDGSEDFYRGWDDYVTGFGNLTGEFWLGLENLHRLTKNATTLRIDMADFEGNTAFAMYSTFRVLSSSTQYTLNVGGYTGTAGDSLTTVHNGRPFGTKDRENNDVNCAFRHKGARWYFRCHSSNLNGLYHRGSHSNNSEGVNWYTWKGHYYMYSLRFTEMKLR